MLADVSRLYDATRTEESKPLVEELRAQKLLRAKIFTEFVSLIEAFGVLCVAIRSRRERSLIWSFVNIEPQEVAQFFDSVLSHKEVNLQQVLKLPQQSRFDKALKNIRDGPLAGFAFPRDVYAVYGKNLRLIAESYRASGGINVTTYNKLKHGFLAVEGVGWISPVPDVESAHILVEVGEIKEGRIGIRPLRLDQAEIDMERTNIQTITLMGSELLALILALDELKLLYA